MAYLVFSKLDLFLLCFALALFFNFVFFFLDFLTSDVFCLVLTVEDSFLGVGVLIELSSISCNSSFISGNTEDRSPHSLCSFALLAASAWAAASAAELVATTGTAVTVKVKV